jgi:hypothetical protein
MGGGRPLDRIADLVLEQARTLYRYEQLWITASPVVVRGIQLGTPSRQGYRAERSRRSGSKPWKDRKTERSVETPEGYEGKSGCRTVQAALLSEGPTTGGSPMYHDMNGWGWGGGALMMIIGLVLLGLVIYGAVRLALQHEKQSTPPDAK